MRTLVALRPAVRAVGSIVRWFSLTLIVPVIVALIYGEPTAPFWWAMLIGTAVGLALERAGPRRDIGLREGFLVVAVGWLAVAAVGALPYIFEGGDIAAPLDAYFESMSGFTTTGSSVMPDIASHGRAILFWRSFTQWLGGMGIIVLALAVLPRLSGGGRALMERESPGPDFDKLVPRIRDTAARLWGVYVGLSAIACAAFWLSGAVGLEPRIGLYSAACHTFAAMATGGFSPEPRSFGAFGATAQWIAIVVMAAAGINFGLWYRGLFRTRRAFLRDGELRAYLALCAGAGAVFTVILLLEGRYGAADAIRHGVFQSVSTITTTGYASADFAVWSAPALLLLLLLMFPGSCSGSTGGAIKIVRAQVAFRLMRREVRAAAHPELVTPLRLSGRAVSEDAVRAVVGFVLLYIVVFVAGAILLASDAAARGLPVSVEEALAASATALGNVGPGFGASGPMGSFAAFGAPGKVVMIGLMWTGRLELLPVLVLLSRSFWLR
jgi:trk system potassium uptake protein TrkH